MKKKKSAKESISISSHIVLPNETNTLGHLMGGELLHRMDVIGAIAAQKHCGRTVVTASVDNVSFKFSPALGDVVTLEAKVTRAFQTSMEIYIKVWTENIPNGTRADTNTAFFTFVAVDGNGRPIPVPEVLPETPEEQDFYESALQRRELRLILSGRMRPEDATELRTLFVTRPPEGE